MGLYDNVEYLMRREGVTTAYLADVIGIEKTSIYKWRMQKSSIDVLVKLADYFDVTLDYLVNGTKLPEGVTKNDLVDLEEILNSNVNIVYGVEELTEEEKVRVRGVLLMCFLKRKSRRNSLNNYKSIR